MAAMVSEMRTQAAIERLAAFYEFRGSDAVVAFVRDHPEVVGPLLTAADVVPRYFGPDAPVVLEVEHDRDSEDHVQLFALVRTGVGVDEGLARFDRFAWEWWLDALPQVAPYLIFGLE